MIKHAGFLALLVVAGLAHADDIKWVIEEHSAFAKAKEAHAIVMVDVFSKADQYSKRFEEGTLRDPQVVALSRQLVPLHLDPAMKEGKELAIKYKINGFPTVLFLSGDRQVVSKLVGYETGPDFATAMQIALDSSREFDAVKRKLETSPRDGEANAKYATFLSAQTDPTAGGPVVGEPYLEKALASSYHGPYLLRALEAVGDAYAGAPGHESKAIACYEKAIQLAKSPAEKTTALIGVMYLQMDTDKAAAKLTAQKIIDLKDATPEWVYAAKEAMQQLGRS
jgi:hypothetical protein